MNIYIRDISGHIGEKYSSNSDSDNFRESMTFFTIFLLTFKMNVSFIDCLGQLYEYKNL